MSSKKEMAIDWTKLRTKFLSEQAKTGISANEFFKKNNVNPNTGRKKFNALAKSVQGEDLPVKKGVTKAEKSVKSVKKADPKPSGSTRVKNPKKVDQLSGSTLSGSTKADQQTCRKGASNKDSSGEALILKKPKRIKLPENSKRLTLLKPERFRDASSDQQILNGGRFSSGNAAAARHGAYLNLTAIDADIIEAVRSNPLNDTNSVSELIEARLVFMNRLLDERIIDLVAMDEKGHIFKDDEGNEETLTDKICNDYWRSMPLMTNIYSTLANTKINASKAAADVELKTYRLYREQSDRDTLISIISAAYDNEEMGALDAVRLIEKSGLKAPALLTSQALKEIELMAPPIDESGISDDEIEALLTHQQQDITSQVQSLAERRQSLQQMMAQSKAEYELGTIDEKDFNQDDELSAPDSIIADNEDNEDFEDGEVLLSDSEQWD